MLVGFFLYFPESHIQLEDGEPSEDFREEVQEFLNENNDGPQTTFRQEQVEVEGGSGGKLQ